jgi:hypothetical protein
MPSPDAHQYGDPACRQATNDLVRHPIAGGPVDVDRAASFDIGSTATHGAGSIFQRALAKHPLEQ